MKSLALLLLVVACTRTSSLVPYASRPDTRTIIGIEMDSSLVLQSVELFHAAVPNEMSICIAGHLEPFPLGMKAKMTAVTPALVDSVSPEHVYLPQKPVSGCPSPVMAIGHDHPMASTNMPCGHSDPDALVLFEDKRVLFSLVFCPFGRGEILFQDGRRGHFIWGGP